MKQLDRELQEMKGEMRDQDAIPKIPSRKLRAIKKSASSKIFQAEENGSDSEREVFEEVVSSKGGRKNIAASKKAKLENVKAEEIETDPEIEEDDKAAKPKKAHKIAAAPNKAKLEESSTNHDAPAAKTAPTGKKGSAKLENKEAKKTLQEYV